MKRFTIVSKNDDLSNQIKHKIHDALVTMDFIFDESNPELVIAVGGDGTFLRTIHKYVNALDALLFVGIHTGTLGFFTSYDSHEVDKFIEDCKQMKFVSKNLPLLEINVHSSKESHCLYALNEIRVENVIRTQLMRIYVENVFLETFRGTGICISSQAGSSAYNRSLGGAILHEGLDLLQITEITGIHHQAYRSLGSPLIVPHDVTIRLESDDFCEAILCYDHESMKLRKDSCVTVNYSKKVVQMIGRPDTHYIERLKNLF